MSNPSAVLIEFDELRIANHADITTSYTPVGASFSNPVRILKVNNFSNRDLYISFDGTTNHDTVASNGGFVYDFGSNKANQAGFLEQSIGKRFYIKSPSTVPTEGEICVTVVYASVQ